MTRVGITFDKRALGSNSYLAYQAMHSPTQAPMMYSDHFNGSIPLAKRRTVAGMVTAMVRCHARENLSASATPIRYTHSPDMYVTHIICICDRLAWMHLASLQLVTANTAYCDWQDEGVGNVTATLKRAGLYNHSYVARRARALSLSDLQLNHRVARIRSVS